MLTAENLSLKNCFGTARNGKHYKICNSRPESGDGKWFVRETVCNEHEYSQRLIKAANLDDAIAKFNELMGETS